MDQVDETGRLGNNQSNCLDTTESIVIEVKVSIRSTGINNYSFQSTQ